MDKIKTPSIVEENIERYFLHSGENNKDIEARRQITSDEFKRYIARKSWENPDTILKSYKPSNN